MSAAPEAECQNCDWQGSTSELRAIEQIDLRVMPGEIMPAGECPRCRALAHLIDRSLSIFTVILLYPDYACDTYGDTFMTSVGAKNTVAAVIAARQEAIDGVEADCDPEDFQTVAVIAGQHDDIAPGTAS